MDIEGEMTRRALDSKIGKAIDLIRHGWNSYNFIFYIGGVSAILGGLFGLAGWLSAIVTVGFFYYAGRFKRRVDLERERRERNRKKKARLG